jgi:hypothetical protein
VDAFALVLAVVLAVACVVFVARPFLKESTPGDEHVLEREPSEDERLRLMEERDRALSALKELEFDHRTHKISDTDYRELVGPLRRQAADALAALERKRPGTAPRQRVDVGR